MIRLDLSREPRWLDLGHGVRVFVEPLTSAVMMAARSELRVALPDPGSSAAKEIAAVALVKGDRAHRHPRLGGGRRLRRQSHWPQPGTHRCAARSAAAV